MIPKPTGYRGMFLFLVLTAGIPLLGSDTFDLVTRLNFYGDNTEFSGPYREGETIFGVNFQSFIRGQLTPRVTIETGIYVNRRHGAEDFVEEENPVLSFIYRGDHGTFSLGSYFPEKRHGFLELIQDSTLELRRPIEYGLEWDYHRTWLTLDYFINWQRINTTEQREIFDMGLVTSAAMGRHLDWELQYHWWHQGGQLTRAERVFNNNVGVLGIRFHGSLAWLGDSSVGFYYAGSKITRDLTYPDRPLEGNGILVNMTCSPFKNIIIRAVLWEGKDFVSLEGDYNYSSHGHEPDFYRSERSYRELGIEKFWDLGHSIKVFGRFRLHRMDEQEIKVSYRFTVDVPFTVHLSRGKAKT